MEPTNRQSTILRLLFEGVSVEQIRGQLGLTWREVLDEIGSGLDLVRQQTLRETEDSIGAAGASPDLGYH